MASDGNFIDNAARQVLYYEGNLPLTGTYIIELNHLPGINQGKYGLRVTLFEPLKVISTPTPTPDIQPTLPPIEDTTPPPVESSPTLEPPGVDIPPINILPTTIPTPNQEETPNPIEEILPESKPDHNDS